ncbi:cysteine dioxygenase type I [Neoconidiobolus thromboides FSU 785]|nr:cysteine dioxygenase type I [Neoconidiobolus thromboides FSU 785]
MDELVKLIRIELGEYGLDSDKVNVKKIQKLMENYQSNSSDWEKYAHFDNNKYTRNLVDDGNGEFNLIVLAWNNGQKSPIHDHAGSHCIMKILDGELQEQLYEWPEESSAQTECCRKMNNYKNTVYSKDQVTYMHDNLGLHRVANYNSDKPALSLHLYTPPIKQAITFQEDSGAKRSGGNCTFYSIRGEKV